MIVTTNVWSATIHVNDTTGDDDTGDGSAENPYETIQKGIDESGRGDIVQTLSGTYERKYQVVQ